MKYEKPAMETMTLGDIQEIVADCVTCKSFFRCGSLYIGSPEE